jgi:hypothetical protein
VGGNGLLIEEVRAGVGQSSQLFTNAMRSMLQVWRRVAAASVSRQNEDAPMALGEFLERVPDVVTIDRANIGVAGSAVCKHEW